MPSLFGKREKEEGKNFKPSARTFRIFFPSSFFLLPHRDGIGAKGAMGGWASVQNREGRDLKEKRTSLWKWFSFKSLPSLFALMDVGAEEKTDISSQSQTFKKTTLHKINFAKESQAVR